LRGKHLLEHTLQTGRHLTLYPLQVSSCSDVRIPLGLVMLLHSLMRLFSLYLSRLHMIVEALTLRANGWRFITGTALAILAGLAFTRTLRALRRGRRGRRGRELLPELTVDINTNVHVRGNRSIVQPLLVKLTDLGIDQYRIDNQVQRDVHPLHIERQLNPIGINHLTSNIPLLQLDQMVEHAVAYFVCHDEQPFLQVILEEHVRINHNPRAIRSRSIRHCPREDRTVFSMGAQVDEDMRECGTVP